MQYKKCFTSARNSVGAEILSSASVYSLKSSLLLDVGFRTAPMLPLSSVVMFEQAVLKPQNIENLNALEIFILTMTRMF